MIFENEMWVKTPKKNDRPERIEYSRVTPRKNRKVALDTLRRHIADWDRRVALARPKHKQLLHLINKFGGVMPFSIAVSKHPDHIIYRWLGVTKAGKRYRRYTHGLVPSIGYLVRIIYAARAFGIHLTPEDLFPDLIENGVLKNPYSHPELKEWMRTMEPDIKTQQLETQIAELLES